MMPVWNNRDGMLRLDDTHGICCGTDGPAGNWWPIRFDHKVTLEFHVIHPQKRAWHLSCRFWCGNFRTVEIQMFRTGRHKVTFRYSAISFRAIIPIPLRKGRKPMLRDLNGLFFMQWKSQLARGAASRPSCGRGCKYVWKKRLCLRLPVRSQCINTI
jgi:hypothetical protein